MAHKESIKISWNKDIKYASKQQFVDAHKDAYPNVDLAAEYDKLYGKEVKSEK